jgi:lysyl-tRNA synthetase class 2
MSLGLQNKIEILIERAYMLAHARTFFAARNILEVDTPHLSSSVIVDSCIDLIPATYRSTSPCYLNSSPECFMKQLLSSGMPNIYQLAHVFRDGEHGRKHNPEFTMCEWYRLNFSYSEMIQETLDFIQHIVGIYPVHHISYRQAFLTHAKLDPFNTTLEALKSCLEAHNLDPLKTDNKDELIWQILADIVEPQFNIPAYTVITHFPPSQASLARLVLDEDSHPVAERFEIYFKSIELANGFCELSDSQEQLARFEDENHKRSLSNKPPLPISHTFIDSLQTLPPCSGVAVGFDRLLMLKFNVNTIAEVLPFPWEHT